MPVLLLGSSIASLGGSQMIRILDWTIPDIFRLVATITVAGGISFLLMYHLIGKKYDKHLIAKLDEKYPDRWQQEHNDNKVSPKLDSNLELNAKVARF